MFLQITPNTQELNSVLSTDNATTTGVLIAIALAFGWVIIYLFKVNQELHKKFIEELKASNEALIKVNNFQNEFVNNMIKLEKK